MRMPIPIRKLTEWLVVTSVVLNGIGFIGRAVEHLLGYRETTQFVRLFHVAEEANLTSYFSSMLLLFSALLLAVITRWKSSHGDPFRRHWAILSGIFFYLCLDEAAAIHEITIEPLRSLFGGTGFFYYSWVILAIPLLLILAVMYFRFVFSLPPRTRLIIIAAGTVFVSGALGFEMLGGYFHDRKVGSLDIYPFLMTMEEFLENIGIVVFIYGLTSYMKSLPNLKEILLEFE